MVESRIRDDEPRSHPLEPDAGLAGLRIGEMMDPKVA
jgi:hypothetical protein